MAAWIGDQITNPLWAYGLVALAVAVDSFFPVVPGETTVTLAAILAADGELSLAPIIIATLIGAFIGDNVSYGLGASLGRRAERRLFSGERARQRLDWARRQLDERGMVIILAARFLPGGRTATTFAAGTLDISWRRFAAIDAAAVTPWGLYAVALGYFGGRAFSESLWKPVLAALVVGALVSVTAELARRVKLPG